MLPAVLAPVTAATASAATAAGTRFLLTFPPFVVEARLSHRRAGRTSRAYHEAVDVRERHLRVLTETIEAVNSTLDLEEVLSLVARRVADAMHTDACFVYLYDERTGELVLRATHGSHVDELTRRPRMRPGEGFTGVAEELG